ncbi:MAG TPA: DUF455 family protein [Longimicrobiaceae bacterium]|nr:DUF455 family protein [Longimicrobiaceae bacterium]
MQLREFAERVLFATDLDEKLAPPPEDLADDRPGASIPAPDCPGRPEALALSMRRAAPEAPLPGARGLEDESQRGLLLHFFANHELLATELMALALLRFPDAPPEFRRGLLATLREEQMHTRLYLKRMRECGVRFGDIPVNGFFWRMVSTMESPLDYVSRLSLTFEQANLDYASHFSQVFRRSGDPATSRVLDRIYRDEIAHVRYGLEWFRRWKAPGSSDWDALRQRLPYPLSPARAKGGGIVFNREGRRRAGIEPAFIERLEVNSASRGRTPDVFFFNANAESRLAGAPYPTSADVLCRDLALLAAPLARSEDVLIVPELPDLGFLQSLVRQGMQPPELVERSRMHELRERKLRALRPWAWTEECARDLGSLIPSVTTGAPPPVARALFSKALSAEWHRALVDEAGAEWGGFLSPVSAGGLLVHDLDDVRSLVTASCRRDGHAGLVVKAPFSTAGKERVVLSPDSGGKAWETAGRLLDRHRALVAEPWLDRIFDFSVQFERAPDSPLRRLGIVALENSPGGAFRACSRPARLSKQLPAELVRRLHPAGTPRPGLLARFLSDVAEPFLERRLAGFDFSGPFGVDAFFYRDPAGTIRLKPIVEINPRFTMGRIALELARRAALHRTTTLRILTLPQVRRLGFASFPAFAASLVPPCGEDRPVLPSPTRFEQGSIALNDPGTARGFLAVASFS